MNDSLLLKMLADRALPWAEQWETSRFIVASPAQKELQKLPEGVTISPHNPGPSVAVRGPRVNSQAKFILRRWPRAGLDSKRIPLLVCTIQGHADLHLGNYVLHCPEGCFVLQPPGVPAYDGSRSHLEGEHRQRGMCRILSLSPWNEYTVRCWVCESKGKYHHTLVNYYIHNRQALAHLKAISDEGVARRDDYERVCRGLLVALFSIVRREVKEGNYVQWIAPENKPPDHLQSRDPVVGAQQYIKAHLSEPLTIERVAHEVFISRSLFARRFRAETGKTFVEYLTECRMAQIEMLLRETDWPIVAVGRAVGLKSSRMLEIFHNHHGMSPGQFRARHSKVQKSG
jgi:AraC-like DNA-binding protein